MMRRASHWTRALAAALAISVGGAVVATAVSVSHREVTTSQLAVAVAELRARAGELEMLAEESGRGTLGETFVRMQARQLLKEIDSSTDRLSKLPAPDLAAELQEARSLAVSLELATRTLARDPRDAGVPGGPLPTATTVGDALERLAQTIEDRDEALP